MAMTRYEPWSLLNQLHREMDNMIRGGDESALATSDWHPSVDIKEEADAYVIYADIPGVDPKDIEVHMEHGVLTIRGERKSETSEERDNFRRVERVRGSFYRRFSLPDTADAEKITARSEHGVLEVRIPKQEKLQPRRIAVEG
ncbi:MAG: Hsp20/alpha crystallin family protein [Gammaproteobacteria bacterium]|nr:Hsp20/alpha crystallin family protein [Gammaproteobacteria bacterium]MDX5375489.1 Hsp20/alpha crystallin family protein [Gammaproteobacteria bacterium]